MKKVLLLLCLIVLIVTLPALAGCGFAATPIIKSVSRTLVDNRTITLSGCFFGEKSRSQPLKYDNFEIGTPTERIVSEKIGGWNTSSHLGGSYYPSYSTTKIRYSGTQSLYQNFTDGNYNSLVRLTEQTLPAGTKKLYFSGWFNMETGGAVCRNTKVLNMDGGTGWQCRLDILPSANIGVLFVHQSCSGGNEMIKDWSISTRALQDDGQWHRLESWLDIGTPNGGDGFRDIYMDLQKIGEISGTFIDSDCSITKLRVGHYFDTDRGSPRPWAKRYWDEIYVDTSRARVEIGNNANWNSCTHREIQIPTAWSSNSISIKVNQGIFETGEKAYIFVVNDNGEVSSTGRKVVFRSGQTGGGDTSSKNVPATSQN
ncbi:MAG: hypothetical protein GY874_13110 [Desulfobacteraceae bacterium]|nr:hypothetical protein [Desulfobacteraceae bacterium]